MNIINPNSMEPLYHSKSLFAVLPEHNKQGMNYEINIYDDHIDFTAIKTFLPAYMANKHGLFGILFNKLFSSMMKKEDFTMDLKNIKKIEIAKRTVMGRKNTNMMFWNIDSARANYENIYFMLNLPERDEEIIKKAFSNLINKVDFSEKSSS